VQANLLAALSMALLTDPAKCLKPGGATRTDDATARRSLSEVRIG